MTESTSEYVIRLIASYLATWLPAGQASWSNVAFADFIVHPVGYYRTKSTGCRGDDLPT